MSRFSFVRTLGAIHAESSRSIQRTRLFSTAAERKFFVGGNWKCNPKSVGEASDLLKRLNASEAVAANTAAEVVVATPHIFLAHAQNMAAGHISISAQDCSTQGLGAFTGETSPDMLSEMGLKYTIVGHSERRAIQGETDQVIAEKCQYAQQQGLTVIACIGELLEEREANNTMNVLQRQLKAYVDKMESWDQFVLAYEPVWAIGTGVTATPDQAQEVHQELRDWLSKNVSQEVADKTRIIYGGSVTADNCKELYGMSDVDGFLVGGASLKEQFIDICTANK